VDDKPPNTLMAHSRHEPDQAPAGLRKRLSPGPGLAAREVAAHQLARIHEATIQLVAEHGYKALKVREIVGVAEVSTRAFYEHFSSKEDCFFQTYQLINRRARRCIIAAQAEEPDWRKRSRLIFEEFASALEREPDSARFALIEAHTVGEKFLEEIQRAEQVFEDVLIESLSRAPNGVVVPPLIAQGVLAGIVAVSKSKLLAGSLIDLVLSGGELVDWALCYLNPIVNELGPLDKQMVWRPSRSQPRAEVDSGDRSLILKSVVKLALVVGHKDLTVSRVRSDAGVSRRKFEAHFDDVEDCYLTALQQRAGWAMTEVARAQASASSKSGGIYRMIVTLAELLAQDPFLARVCLTDDFPQARTGLRVRESLINSAFEMFDDETSYSRFSNLVLEATFNATWSLFRRYVLSTKRWSPIAASLAYVYLTPAIGAEAAVHAIKREQLPPS
jgi:AcrR family transcriptional regulator